MLKTEHRLVCDVCRTEQVGNQLGEWLEVVHSAINYEAGYSQYGWTRYRKAQHVCSFACYDALGRKLFRETNHRSTAPATTSAPDPEQQQPPSAEPGSGER